MSSGLQIRHSLSRAERVRSRALRFERQVLARRVRASQVLERRRNAFKHAGLAFRLWWLSLLGVVSTWLAPLRSKSLLGRRSGGGTSFNQAVRDIAQHVHAMVRTEGLEDRILLTAELAYPSAIVGSNSEVTLSFDSSSSQYRLLDSNLAVVSSAPAASALSGGIRVTGTSDADILRLDTASLSLAGSTASITFVGAGDDAVAVTADANFTLTGSTLTVGSTTFTLAGFERAELTGGVSSNMFTFGDVTIPSVTVDGGGASDTIRSGKLNTQWSIGFDDNLADAGSLDEKIVFRSIENLTGGSGTDAFKFIDGGSVSGAIDGAGGENGLDYDDYTSPIVVDLRLHTATGSGSVTNILTVAGGSADDSLYGPTADAVWRITGEDEGTIDFDVSDDVVRAAVVRAFSA